MADIDDDIMNEEYMLEDEVDAQQDKYLTFKIADEFYGIEIKHVIEIVGVQKITPVPNIKHYINGIINLRGNITPVLEVRKRFGLETIPYTERTCFIVVNVSNSSVGLIVDQVSEVINIPEAQISQPPQTNKGSHSRFIQGIGKIGSQIKILLNINKLLFDEDLTQTEVSEHN